MAIYKTPRHFSQKQLKKRKAEIKLQEEKIKARYAPLVEKIPRFRLMDGFEEIKRRVQAIEKDTVVVVVSGPMGAGKSSFVSRLAKDLNAAHLSTDLYFKSQRLAQRFPLYYDDPRAVKLDKLAKDILGWRQGKAITLLVHDLVTHKFSGVRTIPHTRVLFIEGTMAFHPKIRELADLRVYIDSATSKRLKRRYKRDVRFRGRTISYVRDRFYSTLETARIALLEQWKHKADIIVIT